MKHFLLKLEHCYYYLTNKHYRGFTKQLKNLVKESDQRLIYCKAVIDLEKETIYLKGEVQCRCK